MCVIDSADILISFAISLFPDYLKNHILVNTQHHSPNMLRCFREWLNMVTRPTLEKKTGNQQTPIAGMFDKAELGAEARVQYANRAKKANTGELSSKGPKEMDDFLTTAWRSISQT